MEEKKTEVKKNSPHETEVEKKTTVEEKKREFWEFDYERYIVSILYGIFIFCATVLRLQIMDMSKSGYEAFAAVLGAGLAGLFALLSFMAAFSGIITLAVQNTSSGAMVTHLERDKKVTGNSHIDHCVFLLLVLFILCVVGVVLHTLSPNFQLWDGSQSDQLEKAVVFSACFLFITVALTLLHFPGLSIICRILHRMSTKKLHRLLRKVYLVSNLILFAGLYAYVMGWPILMKYGTFAAYFFSFFLLLIIEHCTEPKDLVESAGWEKTDGMVDNVK